MKLNIENSDIKKLKELNDTKINNFLDKIDDLSEDEAIDFMEYLYDESNKYLNGKEYKETQESLLLEKIADYIYDETN